MKYIFLFIGLLISFSASAAGPTTLDNLSELRWKNRIVLLMGSDDELQLLRQEISKIKDREIAWFLLSEDQIQTNLDSRLSDTLISDIRNSYFRDGENAVLIGKDGGIKARQEEIDLESLFMLIDVMPMRRREMNQ